jgi:hypothetical protein
MKKRQKNAIVAFIIDLPVLELRVQGKIYFLPLATAN